MSQRRFRPLFVLAPLAALAVFASACRGIAQPQGWGAPVLTSSGVITSLHKGKLGLTDLTTKSTVWQFPPDSDKKTKLQGVYGTPAVAGSSVVFGAYDGKVYALNLADGKELWVYDTGASIVGNAAVNDTTAFVGNSDGKVFAINLADGKAVAGRWPFKTGERIWSSPMLDGGTLYVTSMDRRVYALDAATGSERWVNKSADGAVASTPTLTNGRLFFGSFDKHLYALDTANNGTQVWKSSPAADNWFWTHSLVPGSLLYAGSLDGSVYAVAADSGQVRWHQKVGDSIRSSPVLAQGVLVVASRNGRVSGFDPQTGALRWGPINLQSNTLGDLVQNSDGTVLVVTEGGTLGSRLVQIDPQSGTPTDLLKP